MSVELTGQVEVSPEYVKPEITDYGTLQEMTAATQSPGHHTDIPRSAAFTPPAVFS